VSQAEPNPANFCYRHPDRQSFVLCQRCGRTICPECQTQAAVGVHCPECTREAQASAPRRKPAMVSAARIAMNNGAPVVTYSIIALCAVIFVIQYLTGGPQAGATTQALIYYPPLTVFEPWRMVTSIFIHASFIHIGLNMFSLYIFGPILERMLGRGRFIALFLLSGFGGSVAVLLIDPGIAVLGASGALFGLFSAFFVIQRGLGGNANSLLVLIALNLVIGFIPGFNIAWQAHVGGLVVGALAALVFMRTRARTQRTQQILLLAAIAVGLIAATAARIYFALA
jgi:membrane associated rhomboid family serine protease